MEWRLPALRVVGTYLRRAPDHPGRWRLIDPAVRLAPALRTVTSPMTIRVREGFDMLIDGSSQTGRMLYATGEYESETSLLIQRFLKPGDTMIDVGANIGYFSILGARAVGTGGRVFAFEPMPRVRERLERNIALNKLTNVAVRSDALSDTAGPSTFYAGPTDDTGLASLRPLTGSQQVDVTRARFDDLWTPAERVALVKIDVEGAEMAVIRGMSECLKRDSPHVILEVTDDYLRAMGSSAESLVAYLLGFGYSMYRITNGPLVPVSRSSHLLEAPPQFNAVFTKADIA